MKKVCYTLLLILSAIFILGVLTYNKLGSTKGLSAIHNSMSSSILYALDQNKTDTAKMILTSSLIQLVYEYDKEIYSKSKSVKSTLCKDIPRYHRSKLDEYLEEKFYNKGNGLEFKQKVYNNLELIETEFCVDYKETE